VGRAADLLRAIHDESGGRDGFVSLECTPDLADDTEATIEQAQELWSRLDRPNVMIKVPATDAGIPAIEELTAGGVNVNVTLLFSLSRYEQVIDAYIAGLERRVAAGLPVDTISSVASFFVSRVDGKADALLPAGSDLRGRVAIANARRAYARYLERFAGERWFALRDRGARPPAPALGQHGHQGSLLLGRSLRRGADRARRRQHHAREHPSRLCRPRPDRDHDRPRRQLGR
jgi:transaldolase